MRITISGFNLQFDWGTLEIIGDATGKDPVSPVEGLNTGEQALYIFYGAAARAMENDNLGDYSSVTIDKCKITMRSFSIAEVGAVLKAFAKAMSVDAGADPEEEKKSKK